MHGPDETVEGEVEGNFMPGSLFNRTETRLRQIEQRSSGCCCPPCGERVPSVNRPRSSTPKYVYSTEVFSKGLARKLPRSSTPRRLMYCAPKVVSSQASGAR